MKLDEAQRHVDKVQESYVHGESQQLADAQERIRELEKDLANTGEELHGETTKVEWYARNEEWFTRRFEHEKRELNKRIEEEQISNSQDRKSLEEDWKTKLEEEKREHDLELKQLKEEVRTGNQIRESLEQKIKRENEYQEQLEEYGKKMDEMSEEECEKGVEMRKELEKKKLLSYRNTKTERRNYKTS